MNRRGMFAKIAGVALGAVAAKVGLLESPMVARAVPDYNVGTIGGMNILKGGVAPQYHYLDAGWRQFDPAIWREHFDDWADGVGTEAVLAARRAKWEAFMRGDS